MDTSGSATPSAQEVALLRKLARLTRIGAWEMDVASERVFWTEEVYRLHEVDLLALEPVRHRVVRNILHAAGVHARPLEGRRHRWRSSPYRSSRYYPTRPRSRAARTASPRVVDWSLP